MCERGGAETDSVAGTSGCGQYRGRYRAVRWLVRPAIGNGKRLLAAAVTRGRFETLPGLLTEIDLAQTLGPCRRVVGFTANIPSVPAGVLAAERHVRAPS